MKTLRKLLLPLAAILLASCATTGVDIPPSTKNNNVIKLSHKAQITFDRNEISFLTFLNNGQRDQAKVNLDMMEQQLMEIDKSNQINFSFYKASYLINSGSIEAGLLELDNCLQLNPDHLQALFNKAYVSIDYKQSYEEAEILYEKVLTLVEQDSTKGYIPFYFNIKTNGAGSFGGNTEKLIYEFMCIHQDLDQFKHQTLHEIYQSSLLRKDYEKAINCLKQIAPLLPEGVQQNNLIANLSFKLKNYEQAERYYTLALDAGNLKFDNYVNRGTCRYYLKNYTKALSDFEECLSINDNNQLINEQYQYYRNSKEVIDNSIKGNDGTIPNLRNKLTDVQYLKARCQDKLGRKDEAFDTLTALLRYNKSHAMAFYYRGFYYNDKNDPMRAVKDFRRALDRDSSLTNLYYEMAKNYDDFKLYDKAKTNYKLFLEKDKNRGSKKHQDAELRLKQLRSK